jgi:predicted AAA+ superfamily ATPase
MNDEHTETVAASRHPRTSTFSRGSSKTFFSKTYLIQGLTQLLIDVMRRLSGLGRSEPATQLQTPSAAARRILC